MSEILSIFSSTWEYVITEKTRIKYDSSSQITILAHKPKSFFSFPLHFPCRFQLNPSFPTFRIFQLFGILNVSIAECHCCYWFSCFCFCRIGISLLHGVIKEGARDRLIKTTATPGNFSRTLH
ncbi:hypothetical protein LWI29_011937 [Acer saccharum]|uniref:Uncharacterized protein n=1 Tax=Acer saccharum TaxID=4024 RepID=A0AA39TDX3_ACESA|nr:hypothetical protein LWI29_011937 [Acer saccharum]